MLPKKNKLPIQDFVSKPAKTFRYSFFTLKVFPTSPEQNWSRFGVVISKKVYPSAVKRNHLKRLAFNLFRDIINEIAINNYLIIFSPAINKLSDQEIYDDLYKIFF